MPDSYDAYSAINALVFLYTLVYLLFKCLQVMDMAALIYLMIAAADVKEERAGLTKLMLNFW